MNADWERELRRRIHEEERQLHDELLGWARDRALTEGWSDLRVDFSDDSNWRGEYPKPLKIVWEATGTGHVPDLTGTKNGVHRIVEVKRRGAFEFESTADQLRLFAAHAEQTGAKFELYVDGDTEYVARKFVAAQRIAAEVVVSNGRYQYEYRDAIDADGYRDLD